MKKRLLSLLLALVMAAMLLPTAALAAEAPTGYTTDANGIMAYRYLAGNFDLNGYFANAWKSTTFGSGGYRTYVKVGETTNKITAKSSVDGGDLQLGLNVAIDFVFMNEGKTLQIRYTVKNTTTESITFSLGSGADIKIGYDDDALITVFDDGSGFKMVSADTRDKDSVNGDYAQFNFFGIGYSGVTSVSDFWYGAYFESDSSKEGKYWSGNERNAVFFGKIDSEQPKEYYGNADSAAAWHWADQTIEADAEKVYSVQIGIGGAGSENAASGGGISEKTGSVDITLDNAVSSAADFIVTVDDKPLALGTDYTIDNPTSTNPTITFKESAGLTCKSVIKVQITGVTDLVSIANSIPHTFTSFAANGAEITASCSVDGCNGDGGKVTISAPSDRMVDGSEKPATVTNTFHSSVSAAVTGPTYEKFTGAHWEAMASAPIEEGDYRATITLEPGASRAQAPTAFVMYTLSAPSSPVPNTYEVSFDANGGTGTMAAQTFTEGVNQALTPNAFSRDGFTFTGWNTAADGSGTAYADGASITITAPITLYAQWQENSIPVPPPSAEPQGQPPIILQPEEAQQANAFAGDTASLKIVALYADEYQWMIDRNDGKGFTPIPGATRPEYESSPVTEDNDGYRYFCIAANDYGFVQSPIFTLSIPSAADIPQTGSASQTAVYVLVAGVAALSLAFILLRKRDRA